MIQRSQNLGFALETCETFGVLGEGGGKNLGVNPKTETAS
jgi:hypothetical protein